MFGLLSKLGRLALAAKNTLQNALPSILGGLVVAEAATTKQDANGTPVIGTGVVSQTIRKELNLSSARVNQGHNAAKAVLDDNQISTGLASAEATLDDNEISARPVVMTQGVIDDNERSFSENMPSVTARQDPNDAVANTRDVQLNVNIIGCAP